MTRLLSLLLCLSALRVGLAVEDEAEPLLVCGKARFYPSEYTCFSGDFLCPKINGDETSKCGNACYPPGMYSCAKSQLQLLEIQQDPYIMMASNPYAVFHNKRIMAEAGKFWIKVGSGESGSGGGGRKDCPSSLPAHLCRRLYSRATSQEPAVVKGDSLFVRSPGMQHIYVDREGALSFTALKEDLPQGSMAGIGTPYKKGILVDPDTDGYFACPIEGSPGKYQIYAKQAEVDLPSEKCLGLNIKVRDVAKWTKPRDEYK